MSEQSGHKPPSLPPEERSDGRTTREPHTHIGAAAIDLGASSGGEAASPSGTPDTDPNENGPAAFLGSMRTHLRLSGKYLAPQKMPPPEYQPALVNILRINKNYNLGAEHRLANDIAGRFLTNLIRFRKETGIGPADQPELTPTFLEELYTIYAHDIEGFRQYPLPKPELVALFHPRQILTDLDKKYEGHAFIAKKDITMAFGSKRSDPQSALDVLIARVLEFNGIELQLRAWYGVEGKWELTFIRDLCRTSKSAESKARAIFERTRGLRKQYPSARPEVVEVWARTSVADKWGRGRDSSWMLSEVPNLEWNEDEARRGAEQLNRLRQTRRDDNIGGRKNITTVRWAPAAARLVRIAETNWHNDFDAIDMPLEASRVWAGAKTYNEHLGEDETDMAISLEPEHLYYILTAFAEDAARLKEEVPASYVSLIAWHHAPGIYDQYLKKYENDELITPAILRFIIGTAPGNIENKIAQWFKNMHSLQEKFADRIGLDNLRRLARMPDVPDAAGNFLRFEKTAKENHPWALDSEIEDFFFEYEEPGTSFEEWAGKVKEIQRLRPSRESFPNYRCKQIAYNPGTAQEAIQAYETRLEEILTTYEGESRIEKSQAAWWASHYPVSYLDLARAHLRCAAEIEKQLTAKAGITLEPRLVGRLAFKTDISKAREKVEAYLERRSRLTTQAQDMDEPVEQWMVDQVATTARAPSEHVTGKLLSLVALASGSAPRHNAAEALKTITKYLSWLSPLDRMAVTVVFGFTEGTNRANLQEELEVDDLDKYVLNEVVPHISRLIRTRTL